MPKPIPETERVSTGGPRVPEEPVIDDPRVPEEPVIEDPDDDREDSDSPPPIPVVLLTAWRIMPLRRFGRSLGDREKGTGAE